MKHAAGIFLVREDGKILLGHPTSHNKNFYSIPKGKLEKGETAFQAAMRETYEESNVDLRDVKLDKLYELEMVKYKHGRKCIHPFIVLESENGLVFDDFDIKCNAIVPDDSDWNPGKPEFDRFHWSGIDEAKNLLHDTQVECLGQVMELYNESRKN